MAAAPTNASVTAAAVPVAPAAAVTSMEERVRDLEDTEQVFRWTATDVHLPSASPSSSSLPALSMRISKKDFYVIRSGSDAADFTGVRIWPGAHLLARLLVAVRYRQLLAARQGSGTTVVPATDAKVAVAVAAPSVAATVAPAPTTAAAVDVAPDLRWWQRLHSVELGSGVGLCGLIAGGALRAESAVDATGTPAAGAIGPARAPASTSLSGVFASCALSDRVPLVCDMIRKNIALNAAATPAPASAAAPSTSTATAAAAPAAPPNSAATAAPSAQTAAASASAPPLTVHQLEWGTTSTQQLLASKTLPGSGSGSGSVDVVLGADIVYPDVSDTVLDLLFDTLSTLLPRPPPPPPLQTAASADHKATKPTADAEVTGATAAPLEWIARYGLPWHFPRHCALVSYVCRVPATGERLFRCASSARHAYRCAVIPSDAFMSAADVADMEGAVLCFWRDAYEAPVPPVAVPLATTVASASLPAGAAVNADKQGVSISPDSDATGGAPFDWWLGADFRRLWDPTAIAARDKAQRDARHAAHARALAAAKAAKAAKKAAASASAAGGVDSDDDRPIGGLFGPSSSDSDA